jgi:hypothetical protein
LSFQGIASAFNTRIEGRIDAPVAAFPGPESNSSVLSTVLAETNELSFFQNASLSPSELSKMQADFQNITDGGPFPEFASPSSPGSRGSPATTLKELFQNFTISLLSQTSLLPDYRTPYAPPRLTNVTFTTNENVYVYDRGTLWTAYGLATFFSALATIWGLLLMLWTGIPYSFSFSTVVRAARTADMSIHVSTEEGEGDEPLPRNLAEANIVFQGSRVECISAREMPDKV